MQTEAVFKDGSFDGLIRSEEAARRAAATALWATEEERQSILACWSVPDPEEESILSAAAAMVRRRLGAPIAAAALAASQSGVIVHNAARPRLSLPIDDPVLQLLRGANGACVLADVADHPSMAASALCAPGVDAKTVLVAPIRLHGGHAIGVLVAAADCVADATEAQRQDLARLAERTAEEVLARYSARTDPATGALSIAGLTATLGREARRRALHDRPATLAVLALARAPGAPRMFDIDSYHCFADQALAGEAWLVDNDRLPPQILRLVAEKIIDVLRESDMIASVPTRPPELVMDAALDTLCAPQTEGPTCLALLMPETTAEQGMDCVRRIQAWLASVDLPGAPGRHICTIAGVTEIAADRSGGKAAARAALNRAYDAVDAARAEHLAAAHSLAPV